MATSLKSSLFGKWFVFSIEGRVDSFNDKFFFDMFKRSESNGQALVVMDFSATEFLSFSVLKYLKEWHQRLSAKGGRLVLVAPPTSVKRQIDVFLGAHLIPCYRSLDELDFYEWDFLQSFEKQKSPETSTPLA